MDIQTYFKDKKVAVAFSGGVDSSVLLFLAQKYAADCKAYFVKSQFQPQFELDDALQISGQLGVELKIINLDVLSDKSIVSNPENRCYYCKKKIFGAICAAAESDFADIICDGTNASDDVSDRPGFKALKEFGVESPLRDCNITKAEIREIARKNGLAVYDKPSYACLATRIPCTTPIEESVLLNTENAENEMRALGFKNFRVRYLDGAAKLELSAKDFDLIFNIRNEVESALSKYYDSVYLDLKERRDE